MEKDRELKHMCKFCNKSFPCGRSLGGHMRSHVINSAETEEKCSRRNLSSLLGDDAGNQRGYGLRENPKKTCRFADSKIETSAHGKFCKECGKVFQSWKALFGHMKRHSDKERNLPDRSLEEENSWISSTDHNLVTDSQSDNDTANPSRRRRSRRRTTRYMAVVPAASSSLSFANNASCSASEIEQEQEEVAICLMMLSRDVGHWGGFNSVLESCDNSSMFSDDPTWAQTDQIDKLKGKDAVSIGDGTVRLKNLREKKVEPGVLYSDESLHNDGKNLEKCASGSVRDGLKMMKGKAKVRRFLQNDKIMQSRRDYEYEYDISEMETGKDLVEADFGSRVFNLKKKKFLHSYNTEIGTDLKSEKISKVRQKFECTTCNKVFHSYQALGGHRASHKKIKGCFASRVESSENSIDIEVSLGHAVDSELIKSIKNDNFIYENIPMDCSEKAKSGQVSNKSKGHECPICFRVFSSGQALGGHKRSHFLGGSEVINNQTDEVQKSMPEIRDFLDLNLPAPAEDESNDSIIGFKSWWAGSSHKPESLVL